MTRISREAHDHEMFRRASRRDRWRSHVDYEDEYARGRPHTREERIRYNAMIYSARANRRALVDQIMRAAAGGAVRR